MFDYKLGCVEQRLAVYIIIAVRCLFHLKHSVGLSFCHSRVFSPVRAVGGGREEGEGLGRNGNTAVPFTPSATSNMLAIVTLYTHMTCQHTRTDTPVRML